MLIPYRTLLCALGRVCANIIRVEELYPIDYSPEHLALIRREVTVDERKVIKNWLTTREPQLIPSAGACTMLSPLELQELEAFSLQNIVAHGVIAPDASQASYFSFSGVPEPFVDDLVFRLKAVIPYMHFALCNLLAKEHPESDRSLALTERERAILSALAMGLSNAAIAQRVHRSPHTIKHQIAALYKKLNAANRAEAVTLGLAQGLIKF